MKLFSSLLLLCLGCSSFQVNALSTGTPQQMLVKWKAKPITVATLEDINGWGNWYVKDTSKEHGQCSEQADCKEAVLNELGIPFKRMSCTITREWGRPFGHAFLIAHLNDKDYIMDNGAIQDIVWEYTSAIKSTYGVEAIHENK